MISLERSNTNQENDKVMERIRLHTETPNRRDIQKIAEKVNKGAVIIFPTDTIYAMGCIMTAKPTIEKIAKILGKKEKQFKMSLICNDLKMVANYTLPYNNHIFKTMKRYLPGPYTFILNADNSVTKYFKNNKRDIGIRIPDNEITLTLLEYLDAPLISTSLNDNDEYFIDPDEIENSFDHRVEILLDGGQGSTEESTVLDCRDNDIQVMRQGKGPVD